MSDAVPDATTVRVVVHLELDVNAQRWQQAHGWPKRVDSAGANEIRDYLRRSIVAGIQTAPSIADGTIILTERGLR